jgi:hypothetical protein
LPIPVYKTPKNTPENPSYRRVFLSLKIWSNIPIILKMGMFMSSGINNKNIDLEKL